MVDSSILQDSEVAELMTTLAFNGKRFNREIQGITCTIWKILYAYITDLIHEKTLQSGVVYIMYYMLKF